MSKWVESLKLEKKLRINNKNIWKRRGQRTRLGMGLRWCHEQKHSNMGQYGVCFRPWLKGTTFKLVIGRFYIFDPYSEHSQFVPVFPILHRFIERFCFECVQMHPRLKKAAVTSHHLKAGTNATHPFRMVKPRSRFHSMSPRLGWQYSQSARWGCFLSFAKFAITRCYVKSTNAHAN